jgi:hypothetical protein
LQSSMDLLNKKQLKKWAKANMYIVFYINEFRKQ